MGNKFEAGELAADDTIWAHCTGFRLIGGSAIYEAICFCQDQRRVKLQRLAPLDNDKIKVITRYVASDQIVELVGDNKRRKG